MRHGLKVSARGSGHHYGGVSLLEGSVLLDLRQLNSVQVDPVRRLARVGPAATGRQLRAALAPHGLHFPLPHLSDVGLSGFILGGGNGWGVRQYGAAADNVTEVEVVLFDGGGGSDDCDGTCDDGVETGTGGGGSGGGVGCRLARVRADTDPELFWGLRGAGAFLGVALEFELQLYPLPSPSLPLIAATYPLSQLPALLDFFHTFHTTNPVCIEASLSIVGDGGGDGASAGATNGVSDGTAVAAADPVVVLACTAFAPPGSDEVETSYSKLRALLPECRISIQEGPMPYEEALSILDPAWNWPGLCMYGHGAFLPVDSLRPAAAAAATSWGGCGGGAGPAASAATTASGGGVAHSGTGGVAETTTAKGTTAPEGTVAAVLATSGATMTSRRSLLLVCPSAPSTDMGSGRHGRCTDQAACDGMARRQARDREPAEPGRVEDGDAAAGTGCGGGAAGRGSAVEADCGAEGGDAAAGGRGDAPGRAAACAGRPGGREAVERPGADADTRCRGALGFRDSFYVGVYAMWTRSRAGPEADGDAAHVAWVRATAAALAPVTLGLYVNEVMHDAEGQVASSYERGDYERLVALKARVDPRGLLRPL